MPFLNAGSRTFIQEVSEPRFWFLNLHVLTDTGFRESPSYDSSALPGYATPAYLFVIRFLNIVIDNYHMNVIVHLLTSVVLSFILFPFFGYHSLWAIVGGFLIDFDHYLYYVFKFKNLSLKKAYVYHDNIYKRITKVHDILHIFHTIEFWIFMLLVMILSYTYNVKFIFYMFLITLLGMFLHIILDIVHQLKNDAFHERAFSLIGWLKRRNLFW